jgi:hypothetical protein
MEKEPKRLVFELRNEEHDSDESIELHEEVELHTLVVSRYGRVRKHAKRYSPPDLCSKFVSYVIDDEPHSVREAFDSIEGRL